MDKYERKNKNISQGERPDDPMIKKITSINQDADSLVSSTTEKSDDDDKKFFYEKSVSHNVNNLGQHFGRGDDENKRALTQDSSGDHDQNNGSGDEWSMVIDEPMLSDKEERLNEPQGNQMGMKTHLNLIGRGQNHHKKLTNKSFIRRMNIKDEKERPLVLSPKIRAKKILEQESKEDNSYQKKNIFQKVIHVVITTPLNFVRRITIPPSDADSWDRRYAAAVPICATFFIFTVTGMIDFKSVPHFSFWIFLGVASVLSLIIWLTTPYKEEPKKVIVVFAVFAFLLSILWMWSAVNILVDLLGVLGLILGFNPAFLGMTLLAWGNSFGEVMANSTFAKRGLGRMAFTVCFAAPLFDFLIGLGLSLTIKRIRGLPPQRFVISDTEAHIPLMAIGGLM